MATDKPKLPKSRGVYARPSAAIERGSGFFIPGLEGSRVRGLFGVLALALTYFNRSVGSGGEAASEAQILSEIVAVGYGLLLLGQAVLELGKEMGMGMESQGSGVASVEASTSSSAMDQMISSELSLDEAGAVKWAAASFASLTSATHVLLVGDSSSGPPVLLYGLGDLSNIQTEQVTFLQEGIKSAIDTVYTSKGGRVSVPSNHPSAVALLPEESRRCILLQLVGGAGVRNRRCLVVGSDRPLPSFTKNDLRWLGQLGEYL